MKRLYVWVTAEFKVFLETLLNPSYLVGLSLKVATMELFLERADRL